MLKIVVGGQIDKKEVAQLIEKHGGDKVEVVVKSDLDAAMTMKNDQADYYFGACNTGGGGALAMVIAMLGRPNCSTVSMPGNIMSDEKIREEVKAGKKAFGFTAKHKDTVVPVILEELLKENQ
ncbi:MAG: DUF2620 domain-containing protein [Alkalibacterium sp.]|nr:DUF2620 domain-containing protein [Alkalibacterium sp.]